MVINDVLTEKFSILIVDDNQNLAMNLTEILNTNGFETCYAINCRIAKKLCEENIYALILVDLRLPENNGIELIKSIELLNQNVEAIVITGNASVNSAVEACSSRNIIGYYKKPLDIDNLLTVINEVKKRKTAESMLLIKDYAIDSAISGMAITSPDSKIIYANKKFMDLWNIKEKEQLFEKEFSSLWQDETKATEIFKIASQSEQWIGELIAQNEDSGNYTALLSINPIILNNNIQGMMLSCIDISDDKANRVKIKESLKEKEVLLKEIHHRVKNNLQIVSGLLNMGLHYIKHQEEKHLLIDSCNRIHSMALIHETLYNSDNISNIEFNSYFKTLTRDIMEAYRIENKKIIITTSSDPVYDSIEKAIPCGLLVHEIVSNAYKYAFDNRTEGEIKIKLRKEKSQTSSFDYVLTISDNGQALPEDFDLNLEKTMGVQLIKALVIQLRGKINIKSDTYNTFEIVFPAD